MLRRQNISRAAGHSILGVPTYGLIVAIVVFLVVLTGTLMASRWLASLGRDWESAQLEHAGNWAAFEIEHEFSRRSDLVISLVYKWKGLLPEHMTEPSEYFLPLEEEYLFDKGFVYDLEIPELSHQIFPLYSIPVTGPDQELFEQIQLDFGAARMAASDQSNFWFFLNPGSTNPAAVFASKLDKSRFLVLSFPLAESAKAQLAANKGASAGLELRYKDNSVFSIGGDVSDGAEPMVFDVKMDGQSTGYVVAVYPLKSRELSLLAALQKLIIAGGAMLALALGCLIIAWTRSSNLFLSATRKQRVIHDQSPLLYIDAEEDLTIADVNRSTCERLGYSREEIIGKEFSFILRESGDLIESMKQKSLGQVSFRASAAYQSKAGEPVDVTVMVFPVRGTNGRQRWMIIAQDISVQTAAERMTRRSQLQVRFLSKVVESLDEGLLVLDEDGRVVYANPSARRFMGGRGDDATEVRLSDIFHIDDFDALWTEIRECLENNEGWQREFALQGEDPTEGRILVRLSGESVREGGGSTILFLLRDLSKEKELSRRLASSQQMYQLIFDKAPSGIMILDENGFLTDGNEAHIERMARTLEWPSLEDEISLFDNPALLRAGMREPLAQLYNGEEIFLDAVPVVPKRGGRMHYVSIRGIPVLDPKEGNATRAFLFVEDITERHELERQREERTISLEGEKQQAIESSRLKSQFLATISHELRTPLNAILGFSQLIRRRPGIDQKLASNVGKIEDAGQKLLRLVNDLLDISRIDVGQIHIHREQISFPSFMEEIERQAERLARENNNTLSFNVPNEIGIIETDSFRLNQILMNLINNAAKFTREGRITVTARTVSKSPETEYIVITVEDTGVGIPKDQLRVVFDEFYQVDGSATRAYGGSGLGLAICKRLAMMMNGDITVESEENKGSKFHLRIPRRLPAQDTALEPAMEHVE